MREEHTYTCTKCGREFTVGYVISSGAWPLCPDCMEESI